MLLSIYKEYHTRGLEILSVSFDDDERAWRKAIKDDGMLWKHGSDLKGWGGAVPLVKAYAINGIPHLLLLDENNRIIASKPDKDKLRESIAGYLDKK